MTTQQQRVVKANASSESQSRDRAWWTWSSPRACRCTARSPRRSAAWGPSPTREAPVPARGSRWPRRTARTTRRARMSGRWAPPSGGRIHTRAGARAIVSTVLVHGAVHRHGDHPARARGEGGAGGGAYEAGEGEAPGQGADDWAEASERVEEEASRGGGFLSGRMRRFTEEIERGWTKDYAGKSTGLTAKSRRTCDTTSSTQNMCPCDMWPRVMRHAKARDDPVVVCVMYDR